MAYTLLVCADIGRRQKLNIEFPFDEKPALGQLQAAVQAVFEFEQQRRQNGSGSGSGSGSGGHTSPAHPFVLERMQIYNDGIRQWVDLVSSSQLHPYDQVYAYARHPQRARRSPSPDGTGGRSGDGGGGGSRELPPPTTSAYFASPPRDTGERAAGGGGGAVVPTRRATAVIDASEEIGETVRAYAGTDIGAGARGGGVAAASAAARDEILVISSPAEARDMTPEERMHLVFSAADRTRNEYLSPSDFRELFNATHILFNRATVDEIFKFSAANGTYLSFNDFAQFCREYPVTFNALFTRIADRRRTARMERAVKETADEAAQLRLRREELQRELERVTQQLTDTESENRATASELAAHVKHRGAIEEEEQVLLDKEARVAFQREILRREEADFIATARRFDLRADSVLPSPSPSGKAAVGGAGGGASARRRGDGGPDHSPHRGLR